MKQHLSIILIAFIAVLSINAQNKFYRKSGGKSKYRKFNGDELNTIVPSVFLGIQFPGDMNLTLKYYLEDYLNLNYKVTPESVDGYISDLSKYNSMPMIYLSLNYIVDTKKAYKAIKERKTEMASLIF